MLLFLLMMLPLLYVYLSCSNMLRRTGLSLTAFSEQNKMFYVSENVQVSVPQLLEGFMPPHKQGREARMLDQISGMYSNIFGSNSSPTRYIVLPFCYTVLIQHCNARKKHPVVFLPDGSSKPCKQSGQMSSMGYLAFMLSGIVLKKQKLF